MRKNKRRTKPTRLRVAGLFAGIGGFELGLQRAGHRAILLCEINNEARAVLRRRFPAVRLASDVRRLRSLPRCVDLITAGFPCQDFSQAGPTRGFAGKHSKVVWEIFRLIEKRKPQFLLFENVPFMLRLGKGAAVKRLVKKLEQSGYKWAYRVIDAQGFGIPQRRARIFILASLGEDPRNILLSDDGALPASRRKGVYGFYWTEGNTGIGLAIDSVPALKGGSAFGIPSPPAIACDAFGIVTPHLCDAERLQGFPPYWTAVAVSASKTKHRWRLIGNAVNVRVASWIGYRLRTPRKYRSVNDQPLTKGRWPIAAYNVGGGRFESLVGCFPLKRKRPSLVRFLRFPSKRLSKRAAEGIMSRLQKSSLTASRILIARLRTHLRST
jgi:DNA (cytosine-5)-methyltransferase 1